jgi:hypothetical protein
MIHIYHIIYISLDRLEEVCHNRPIPKGIFNNTIQTKE